MEYVYNCKFDEHITHKLKLLTYYGDKTVCVSCLNFLLSENSIKKILLKFPTHQYTSLFNDIKTVLNKVDITIMEAFIYLPISILTDFSTNVLLINFVTPQKPYKPSSEQKSNKELIENLLTSTINNKSVTLITILQNTFKKLISLSSFLTTNTYSTNEDIIIFLLEYVLSNIKSNKEYRITTTKYNTNLIKYSFDLFYYYRTNNILYKSLKLVNNLTTNKETIPMTYTFIKNIDNNSLTDKHIKWVIKLVTKSLTSNNKENKDTKENSINNNKMIIKLTNILIYTVKDNLLYKYIIKLIEKSLNYFNLYTDTYNNIFLDILKNRTLYDMVIYLIENKHYKIILSLYKPLTTYITTLNNSYTNHYYSNKDSLIIENSFIITVQYYEIIIQLIESIAINENNMAFNYEDDLTYIVHSFTLTIIQCIESGYSIKTEIINYIINNIYKYIEKTNYNESSVMLFFIVLENFFSLNIIDNIENTNNIKLDIYNKLIENNMLVDFVFLINNEYNDDVVYRHPNTVYKFFTITKLYLSSNHNTDHINYRTINYIIKIINNSTNTNILQENKLLIVIDVIKILLMNNKNYNDNNYIECIYGIKDIIIHLLLYNNNTESLQFILNMFIQLYQPISILGCFVYRESFIDTHFLSSSKYNKDLYITQLNGHLITSINTDIINYSLIDNIKPLLFYLVEFLDIKKDIILGNIINLLQLIISIYLKNYSDDIFYYMNILLYLYYIYNSNINDNKMNTINNDNKFIFKTMEIIILTYDKVWEYYPTVSMRSIFIYSLLFSVHSKDNESVVFSLFDYIRNKTINIKETILNYINKDIFMLYIISYIKSYIKKNINNKGILSFILLYIEFINNDDITIDIIKYILNMETSILKEEQTNKIVKEIICALQCNTIEKNSTNSFIIGNELLYESIDKFKHFNKENSLDCIDIYIKIYSVIFSNYKILIDNRFIKTLIIELGNCLNNTNNNTNNNVYGIYLIVKWVFSKNINKNSKIIQNIYKSLFIYSYNQFKTKEGEEIKDFLYNENKYMSNNNNNNKEIEYIKYIINNI